MFTCVYLMNTMDLNLNFCVKRIFVLEKRGEEGLIVWRKEFAIYIFLLFCNMSKDQIFYHYYNVWQSHLFALFIDFSTHSLFYCLQ